MRALVVVTLLGGVARAAVTFEAPEGWRPALAEPPVAVAAVRDDPAGRALFAASVESAQGLPWLARPALAELMGERMAAWAGGRLELRRTEAIAVGEFEVPRFEYEVHQGAASDQRLVVYVVPAGRQVGVVTLRCPLVLLPAYRPMVERALEKTAGMARIDTRTPGAGGPRWRFVILGGAAVLLIVGLAVWAAWRLWRQWA